MRIESKTVRALALAVALVGGVSRFWFYPVRWVTALRMGRGAAAFWLAGGATHRLETEPGYTDSAAWEALPVYIQGAALNNVAFDGTRAEALLDAAYARKNRNVAGSGLKGGIWFLAVVCCVLGAVIVRLLARLREARGGVVEVVVERPAITLPGDGESEER